jgi:hypothetical protein
MLRGMYPGGDNKAGGDMVVDTSRGGWGGASLGPAVPVMAQPGPGDPIPGFNPLPVLDDAAANPLPVLEAVAANPVLVVEAGAVVAPAPSPSPKPLTPEEVLFASRADESLDVEAPLDKPRDLADKIKKAAARRAKNHMAWHDNVPATGLYALVSERANAWRRVCGCARDASLCMPGACGVTAERPAAPAATSAAAATMRHRWRPTRRA